MSRIALSALALFALSPTALANSHTQAEGGPLQAVDIFSLEMARDTQISPDGRWVAYQRRSNDIMTDQTRSAIWTVAFEGGSHRPLVTGSGSYSSPRWSPSSERLAYIASEDGTTRLKTVWRQSGRTATLAQLPGGAGQLSWSPDGQWLAFTMFTPAPGLSVDIGLPPKPPGAVWAESALVDETTRYEFDGAGELPSGFSQIYVIAADGGAPRQLTQINDGSISGLSWAPTKPVSAWKIGS